MALAYAQYLHCQNPGPDDSCGACPSCKKHQKLIHPDMHFVFPVASTAKVSKASSRDFLPEWRESLLEFPYLDLDTWLQKIGAENKKANISVGESRHIIKDLSLKSFEGSYKIMLLWQPEWMHPAAANAILKILEEPSPRTIFLMVSHNRERLLVTILSRVQMRRIPAFEDEDLMFYLQDALSQDEETAQQIAFMAQGNILQARHLSQDQDLNQGTLFQEWMRACYRGQAKVLLDLCDQFSRSPRAQQVALLRYGLVICRESLICHSQSGELLRIPEEKRKFVQNFSRTLNLGQLNRMYELLNEAVYHLEGYANPRILFFDLSWQMGGLLRN